MENTEDPKKEEDANQAQEESWVIGYKTFSRESTCWVVASQSPNQSAFVQGPQVFGPKRQAQAIHRKESLANKFEFYPIDNRSQPRF